MSQSITFNQIRAEVALLDAKRRVERAVGIRSSARWLGEPLQTDGTTSYMIRQCDSPLSLRLALREPLPTGASRAIKVLVTDVDRDEVTEDVFARLHRERFHPIDRWSLVAQQFAAESIDPRLTRHPWLADAVVEYLAGRRSPAAKTGCLDAETLWRELLDATIGLQVVDLPDMGAVLRWSLDAGHVQQLRGLAPELRAGVEEWLRTCAGDVADFVFAVADHSDRPDAVPLALATRVLVGNEAGSGAERCLGKIEGKWLAGRQFTADQLRRVGSEAVAMVRSQMYDPADRRRITARAEELLREVDGTGFAHSSPILPLGFNQRLGSFATAMRAFTEDPAGDIGPVAAAAARARAHDQAHLEPGAVERIDMAARLARWLVTMRAGGDDPESLTEAAVDYLRQGSWVDWARTSLGREAATRELSEAVATIHAAATVEQERRAANFAAKLAPVVTSGVYPSDVLLVEQVLDEVVAAIARERPVLMIVLDGMSAAVSRELIAELLGRRHWATIVEQGHLSLRPAIAVLPSATQYSRASLLAGRLAGGTAGSADETTAFAAHAALKAACTASHGPKLYLKGDLEGPDKRLATAVREDVASPKRKVIGTVINAIDDTLAKADQIDLRWTASTIPILEALLDEAMSGKRAVVLVSDHGHVLEAGTTARVTQDEGGERWRPPGAPTAPDEISFQGSRVLNARGGIVTTWSEKVRYTRRTNRGYHGGASPQEMIVPITVLIPQGSEAPAGWTLAGESSPSWWDEAEILPRTSKQPPAPPPPGMLFDKHPQARPPVASVAVAPEVGDVPAWVEATLASEVFESQKRLATRGYPGDDTIKKLLTILEARGNTSTFAAISRSLPHPLFRLKGLLSQVQRVLNIDGYPVIAVDTESESVVLQKHILLVQFGVSEGGK
jgi:hypothetical protein